jgi:hypothetical protein
VNNGCHTINTTITFMHKPTQHDPLDPAGPSPEELDGIEEYFNDPTHTDMSQGSEFLDDSLRMVEQPLQVPFTKKHK